MSDIAAIYADGIQDHVGEPAHILGISTGGSIALQLAVDHQQAVRRLALAATAHELGPEGHVAQSRYVKRARAGKRPSPALSSVISTSAFARPLAAAALWLGDGRANHIAAATLLNAENTSTIGEELHRIAAPTLLVSGDQDRIYPEQLARQTTHLIPNASHITHPGCAHEQVLKHPRLVSEITTFLSKPPGGPDLAGDVGWPEN